MEPPSNRVDEHGFPIPPRFDDEPVVVKRQGSSGRARLLWRLMFAAMFMAVVVNSPVGSGMRHFMGRFHMSRAFTKYLSDDLSGAIGSSDWAVRWSYDDPKIYCWRGRFRLEGKDLRGSLDDYNRAIELDPSDSYGYIGRSVVHQRLKDIDAALADLDLAVQRRTAQDPQPFNARAYAKAVAGVDLEAALADAEKALAFAGPDNAAILDTRGYFRYRLGQLPGALEDLDHSIELTEQWKQHELDRLSKGQHSEAEIGRQSRNIDENLAVMYYHRGLVYEKMGQESRAKSDLEHGYELGYNPDEGVF